VSLVRSARRLILWVSRKDCELKEASSCTKRGEESGPGRGESGEQPDSGAELVYCKPELKEQGPKKNRVIAG